MKKNMWVVEYFVMKKKIYLEYKKTRIIEKKDNLNENIFFSLKT